MHEDTPTIVLNVMPLGDQTWVLLAHHRRFDGRLGRMLLDLRDASESEFGQFMTRMLVVHCENTVFRPSFIAGLSEAERAKLVDAFGATMIDAPPFDEVDVKSFFGMVAD